MVDNLQFLDSKKSGQVSGQQNIQNESEDPFADFGEQVSIDDNEFLD